MQNRIIFQIRNSDVILFRLPERLFAPLAHQLPFYLTCLMCSPWKVARNCLKQSNKRYFLVEIQDYHWAQLKGVYMEGDCLLHLVHQEQSAENLQWSPSSTKSNTEHCVLWKNSPFPRQILPLLRKVLSPALDVANQRCQPSSRSGLNVISEFNLDNTTNFNKEDRDTEGEKGSDAKKVEDINVDYSLYSKFWQIQDFFR